MVTIVAETKQLSTMEKRPSVEILSPYQHELNGQGTDCASDCPAFRWVALAVLSPPDFPQLLRLAIDRDVTRVSAQQDESRLGRCATRQALRVDELKKPADEKEENHTQAWLRIRIK